MIDERIPLARPNIEQVDIDAVVEALKSGWLTAGPRIREFEEKLAEYVGTKFAVVVNSGTAALHLALLAHNIGREDEVIVPALTFVATANSVMHCGAKPVFADSELDTFNIDVTDVKKRITKRTKAIIPVHIAGLPCDMAPLMELAEEKDLVVIEDVAEALGASYKGKKAGSFGEGCFSFFPTKNITTGEGGAIASDNEALVKKTKELRAHGIAQGTWERETSRRPWERLQVVLGYNYRMTDFQAALGMTQLQKVDKMNDMRKRWAERYNKLIAGVEGFTPQHVPRGYEHVYQMYLIRVDHGDRDRVVEYLRGKGIEASAHFNPPVHLNPFYREVFGYSEGVFPIAERISKTILTLPMYPCLKPQHVDTIVDAMKSALENVR